MTFVNRLRAKLDAARVKPALLGLRPFTITVWTRSWSGGRSGLGSVTDGYQALTVGDGYAPHVRQLSQRDVIASGGLYSEQDLEVTLTAAYDACSTSGGFEVSDFDPPRDGYFKQVLFIVTGPGMPTAGRLYQKKGQRVDSSYSYSLILTATGQNA
jgi:hypothetical protein